MFIKHSTLFVLLVVASSRLFYKSPEHLTTSAQEPFGALPKGTTCNKVDATKLHEGFKATQVVYSGYLNVKEGSKSCLGYIFYGSQKAEKAEDLSKYPSMVWLNGGPGSSSQMGNFLELGPVMYGKDKKAFFNQHSWTTEYNVLFIDQPIGTGLSYAETTAEIPTNMDQVGAHFLYALQQFLSADEGCTKKHQATNLNTSPWFLFGESYAGKYVPSIAQAILKFNKDAATKVPLKGIGIGDPFTDPYAIEAEYASYAYNLGLIDAQERSQAEQYVLSSLKTLNSGDSLKAKDGFEEALDWIVTQSGNMNVYNVLVHGTYDEQEQPMMDYLNLDATKTLFGFSLEYQYNQGSAAVYEALSTDFMKRDCVERLEEVLKSIPVLVYNGQNDLIVTSSGTMRWVNKLKYDGIENFQKKDFEVWKLNDKVVGYFKYEGNLELAMVNNAGHLVPMDQPAVALDLVKKFVSHHI